MRTHLSNAFGENNSQKFVSYLSSGTKKVEFLQEIQEMIETFR